MILKFNRKMFGKFKREFNISGDEEQFIKSLPGNENLDDEFLILYTVHNDKIYIASISTTLKIKNRFYKLKTGFSTDFWLDFSNSISRHSFEVKIGKRHGRLIEAKITGVYVIRFNNLEKYVSENRLAVISSDYEDGSISVGIVDDFDNIIDSENLDKLIRMYYDGVELITINSDVFRPNEENNAYLLRSSKIKIKEVQFSIKPVKVTTPIGDTLELDKIAVKIMVELFGEVYEAVFFVREGYIPDLLYHVKSDITDYSVKFDGFDEYAGVCTEYFTEYVLPLVKYAENLKNDEVVRDWTMKIVEELSDRIVENLINGRLDDDAVEKLRSIVDFLKELYYQEKLISEYIIRDVENLLGKKISEKFEEVFKNMPGDLKQEVLNVRGDADKLVEAFEFYFTTNNIPEKVKKDIEFDINIFIRDLVSLLIYKHIY